MTTRPSMSGPFGARQHLRDLPGELRTVIDEFTDGLHHARTAAHHLLPFVCRAESARRVEEFGFEMFHESYSRGQAGDTLPAGHRMAADRG